MTAPPPPADGAPGAGSGPFARRGGPFGAASGSPAPAGPTTGTDIAGAVSGLSDVDVLDAGGGPDPLAEQFPPEPGSPAAPRPPFARRRSTVLAVQVLILVALVGTWQALASAHVIDEFFFGSPAGTWDQLYDWMRDGTQQGSFWQQIWVTLQETLIGFGIGVGLGVLLGVLLGRVAFLARVFNIYISGLNSIPRIVLGSVFVIWFGLGMQSKIALAVVLVFFSVFFNAFQGAREVDRGLVANARVLGASDRQILLHVVLPSAFSWIIASLRIAFGLAITGAVVGELIGASQGLGVLIQQAQGLFDPDGVYAGLVATTIVALSVEGLITVLERRALRWRPPRNSLDPAR